MKQTYQKAAQLVKNLFGMGKEILSDQGKRYQLAGKIGEGGMGAVYKAVDAENREVAVKITNSDQGIQRFKLEIAILKLLGKHPNIPEIVDWGLEASEAKFCVMEYVPGESLHGLIKSQPRWFYATLLRHTLEVSFHLLKAVDHAHRKKVIHRDIKPSNIIVRQLPDGKLDLKLMDFGVAKALEKGFLSFLHRNISFDEKDLTLPGEPIGTLGYAAPEQIDNAAPDETADIFSCGATIYEMLQGGFLFRGKSISKYLLELSSFTYQPVTLAAEEVENCMEIAERLNAVLSRALAVKPQQRYRRGEKMLREISSLREEFYRKVASRS